MSNRRQAIATFGAASAAALPFTAHSTRTMSPSFVPRDSVSLNILRNTAGSLPVSLKANADPAMAVSRGFMSTVERNLARISDNRIRQVLFGCGPQHLDDLLGAYGRAEQRTGRTGALIDLLAVRLPATDLARLSPHFMPDRLWQAVGQLAPQKLTAFANALEAARLAGFTRSSQRAVPGRESFSGSAGATIEMTIHEIYLSFRTAPVGSLGVLGASYQTLVYSSMHLGAAWYGGQVVGTGINWLIDRYAPSIGDAIGGTIYNIIESIRAPFIAHDPFKTGQAQEAASWHFALGGVSQILEATGGDFQVVSAWNALSGGSCGVDPDGCPIVL